MKRLIIPVMKVEDLDEEDPRLLLSSVTTWTVELRVDVLDVYVIIVFVSLLGDFIPIFSFQPIESQSFSSLLEPSITSSSSVVTMSEALYKTRLMMNIMMTERMVQIPMKVRMKAVETVLKRTLQIRIGRKSRLMKSIRLYAEIIIEKKEKRKEVQAITVNISDDPDNKDNIDMIIYH